MSNSKEQPRTHKTHIHTSPFITGVFLAVVRVRDHRLNPLHFACLNCGQVGKLRHSLRPRRVSKLLSLNHRRGFVGGHKRGCVCVLVVLCISADPTPGSRRSGPPFYSCLCFVLFRLHHNRQRLTQNQWNLFLFVINSLRAVGRPQKVLSCGERTVLSSFCENTCALSL